MARTFSKSFRKENITFAFFFEQIYMPLARRQKKSWPVDERIGKKYLLPVFGPVPLASLTKGLVEGWIANLRSSELQELTCNRIISSMSYVCTVAQNLGMMGEQSPFDGVDKGKKQKPQPTRLTPETMNRVRELLEASDNIQAKAILLMLYTGCKKSIILQATWEQLDLDNAQFHLPQPSSQPFIRLSRSALDIVAKLPRVDGSKYIFPSNNPLRPIHDVSYFWNHLREEHGLGEIRITDISKYAKSFAVMQVE